MPSALLTSASAITQVRLLRFAVSVYHSADIDYVRSLTLTDTPNVRKWTGFHLSALIRPLELPQ